MRSLTGRPRLNAVPRSGHASAFRTRSIGLASGEAAMHRLALVDRVRPALGGGEPDQLLVEFLPGDQIVGAGLGVRLRGRLVLGDLGRVVAPGHDRAAVPDPVVVADLDQPIGGHERLGEPRVLERRRLDRLGVPDEGPGRQHLVTNPELDRRDAPQPAGVLHDDRIVETVAVLEVRLHQRGLARLHLAARDAESGADAARAQREQHEDEQRDPDQRRDHQHQSSGDVREHGAEGRRIG